MTNRFSGVEVIIFDCDGVLIDSELIANEAFARVLRGHGFSITGAELGHRFTGTDIRKMFKELSDAHAKPIPPTLREEAYALIGELYRTELQAIPGIHALLDRLSHRRCVASSSEPGKLRHGLDVTALTAHFDPHIYSAHQVSKGKPAPDIFFFAAEQMGVAPEACLVIEDSIFGIEAARAAGMPVIGFTGGSHCGPGYDRVLRDAGADTVIAEIGEVEALV